MSEIQLENTLYAFVEGEYDIIVTTTIIETGVDIPNANTLFIENADHMGLSTLYQLRGRVGVPVGCLCLSHTVQTSP